MGQSPPPKRLTIGILAGWQVYHIYLNSFVEGVYNGIQAAAEHYDANLIFACGIDQISRLDEAAPIRPAWPQMTPHTTFAPVSPSNTHGLIAISPLLSPERSTYMHRVMAEGHPVIFVGSGESSPSITYDHHNGILQAIRHLVRHGHQRIAFIAGHPEGVDRDSDIRLAAYCEAVRLYGLDNDPDLIAFGRHSHAGGREAMQTLLHRGTAFTAAAASNDESAVAAMQVCYDAGMRIPDDIALIGFDNRLEAAAQEPPLSTIQIPLFEVGFRACEALIQHLHGIAPLDLAYNEVLDVRLVRRESCGCTADSLLQAPPPSTVDAPQWQTLTTRIVDQVSTDIMHLSRQLVAEQAAQLVDAFRRSVSGDAPPLFLATLLGLLKQAEMLNESPYAWQHAIRLLEADLPGLVRAPRGSQRCVGAEQMLFEAQSMIAEHMRRQHIDYIVRSDWIADQLGQVSAYLSSLMDEAKILDMLANHLTGLGIIEALVRQIDVVFVEPSAEVVPETSILATRSASRAAPERFPTFHFPPEGLYGAERCEVALLPLVVSGQQIGYVAFNHALLKICANIVRGISTALHSAKLYQQALTAQQLAEEANRMKTRFLSTVSHELRAPLDVISGSSDVLLGEAAQQPEQAPAIMAEHIDDLKRIQASARHLNSLITDVMQLTQSEVGHLSLTWEVIDLAETLRPILDLAQQMVEGKGLVWQAVIAGDLPPLWGDRVRLRQVILNLVSNAAKFTEHGEVRLAISAQDGVIAIEVCDTGIGVPTDEQPLIFGEFHQSARTTGRGYQGLGLGLTICQRLVEMHGGTITVQSAGEEGQGSEFRVLLPALNADVPAIPPIDRECVVLVVDDEPLTLRTHERLLFTQLPGTRVLTAHNGRQALDLAGREKPDLVVLDLMMPEMDGYAVVEAFRQHPVTHAIPIIILSGKSLGEADMKRLGGSVNAILNKGVFGSEEILHHIRMALSGQQRLGDSTQSLVRSAMAYLHEHYMEPITREDIARHVSVSEDYLTACFQRELGISPIAYLNRYRISRAKILMSSTSMSMTEIALEVGFSTSTYFSRVFRRETGLSPSQYRGG